MRADGNGLSLSSDGIRDLGLMLRFERDLTRGKADFSSHTSHPSCRQDVMWTAACLSRIDQSGLRYPDRRNGMMIYQRL